MKPSLDVDWGQALISCDNVKRFTGAVIHTEAPLQITNLQCSQVNNLCDANS